MIVFKDNDPRLEAEFKYDTIVNSKLKKILYMLALYCEVEFGKDITITELYRTQDEQDQYYEDNQRYKEKPWKSVHQFGRGADVRSKNFEPDEAERIIKFLKCVTYRDGSKSQTVVHHDIGLGEHFHIQVSY